MRAHVYRRSLVWCVVVCAMVQGVSWMLPWAFPSSTAPSGRAAAAGGDLPADVMLLGNSRSDALELRLLREAHRDRWGREPVIVDLRRGAIDGINQFCLYSDYRARAGQPPAVLIQFLSLEDVLDRVPTLPEEFSVRSVPSLIQLGLGADHLLDLAMAKANWLYANKSRVNSEVMEWLFSVVQSSQPSTAAQQASDVDWNERLQRHCYVAELGTIEPVKVRAVREVVTRQAEGGRTLVVLPPYHDDLRSYLSRSASYRAFLEMVESLKRIPGVTLVSDRFFRGDDRRVFFDPTHLTDQGGAIFTRQLLAQYAEAIWPEGRHTMAAR